MKKTPNLLPKKISDCIVVALKDLDAAKAAGMKVDMKDWYYRDTMGVCSVCLAGAVLAREFDLDKAEVLHPGSELLSEHDSDRLRELNRLRSGFRRSADVGTGITMNAYPLFGFWQDSFEYDSTGIPPGTFGDKDTKAWRREMAKMAKYLKSKGY